jgi:hypothetical protein
MIRTRRKLYYTQNMNRLLFSLYFILLFRIYFSCSKTLSPYERVRSDIGIVGSKRRKPKESDLG